MELEKDITCTICTELFIDAVTLTCLHAFCKYCIEEWRQRNSSCPICRTTITAINRTLVVDIMVKNFYERASEEVKQERKTLVSQRTNICIASTSRAFVDYAINSPRMVYNNDTDSDEDNYYENPNNYYNNENNYDVNYTDEGLYYQYDNRDEDNSDNEDNEEDVDNADEQNEIGDYNYYYVGGDENDDSNDAVVAGRIFDDSNEEDNCYEESSAYLEWKKSVE